MIVCICTIHSAHHNPVNATQRKGMVHAVAYRTYGYFGLMLSFLSLRNNFLEIENEKLREQEKEIKSKSLFEAVEEYTRVML